VAWDDHRIAMAANQWVAAFAGGLPPA